MTRALDTLDDAGDGVATPSGRAVVNGASFAVSALRASGFRPCRSRSAVDFRNRNMVDRMTDNAQADDGWIDVASAPEGRVVETKIDDAGGERNVQRLQRKGRLWWTPDGAMYVYYTPTHWREVRP